MKITEINWTEGKRYKDMHGECYKVSAFKTLVNERSGDFIDELMCLHDILKMEFEEVEEVKEKKYYLWLNKPYVKAELAYLNYELSNKRLLMCDKTNSVEAYKTQFSKAEIKELIDKFGGSILDFERVEVKNEEG